MNYFVGEQKKRKRKNRIFRLLCIGRIFTIIIVRVSEPVWAANHFYYCCFEIGIMKEGVWKLLLVGWQDISETFLKKGRWMITKMIAIITIAVVCWKLWCVIIKWHHLKNEFCCRYLFISVKTPYKITIQLFNMTLEQANTTPLCWWKVYG